MPLVRWVRLLRENSDKNQTKERYTHLDKNIRNLISRENVVTVTHRKQPLASIHPTVHQGSKPGTFLYLLTRRVGAGGGGGGGKGGIPPNFSSQDAGYTYAPLNLGYHLAYQHICPPPQDKIVPVHLLLPIFLIFLRVLLVFIFYISISPLGLMEIWVGVPL